MKICCIVLNYYRNVESFGSADLDLTLKALKFKFQKNGCGSSTTYLFCRSLRRYRDQVFEMYELYSLSVSISSLNSVSRRKSKTLLCTFQKVHLLFLLYPHHTSPQPIFMTDYRTFERWRRKWTKVSTTCSPTWWAPHRRRPSGPASAAVGRAPPPASPATGRVGNKLPSKKNPKNVFLGFFFLNLNFFCENNTNFSLWNRFLWTNKT